MYAVFRKYFRLHYENCFLGLWYVCVCVKVLIYSQHANEEKKIQASDKQKSNAAITIEVFFSRKIFQIHFANCATHTWVNNATKPKKKKGNPSTALIQIDKYSQLNVSRCVSLYKCVCSISSEFCNHFSCCLNSGNCKQATFFCLLTRTRQGKLTISLRNRWRISLSMLFFRGKYSND